MSNKVNEGLYAVLASLVLVAVLYIPQYSQASLIDNLTSTLLLFGLFFGFALLVETSYREWEKSAEEKRHPVSALLLVLMSSTLMFFFFMGFLLRAGLFN